MIIPVRRAFVIFATTKKCSNRDTAEKNLMQHDSPTTSIAVHYNSFDLNKLQMNVHQHIQHDLHFLFFSELVFDGKSNRYNFLISFRPTPS